MSDAPSTDKENTIERRLGAIMFTDVVGYTSLSEQDETRALELLKKHRGIVRPLIQMHRGREIKTMGDAFLVEFQSAIDAVECGVDIQRSLTSSGNDDKDNNLPIRIGIHLGEIMHTESDVYGDAVNVASRIEPLAEPGGICVSAQVRDSVKKRLRNFEFESLGAKTLKNVGSPVEVFKVRFFDNGGAFVPTHHSSISLDKRRVAVLPFVNISPDPSDEFFSDGMTEELIARLSELRQLKVIARTSVMNYKKNQKNIPDIARELGAGTIVEGSVRKAASKIRVTVQVINPLTQEHLWSSTYDSNLDDIFAIQEDIARKVADAFSKNYGEPVGVPGPRPEATTTTRRAVEAYTDYLHAKQLVNSAFAPTSIKEALEIFDRAVEKDPNLAKAFTGRALAIIKYSDLMREPHVVSAKRAEADALRALQIDPNLAEGYSMLATVNSMLDDLDAVQRNAEKAIELNPSDANAYRMLSHLASLHNDMDESLRLAEIAYRLDPLNEFAIANLAETYMWTGRENEAFELGRRIERIFPSTSFDIELMYYLVKRDFPKFRELTDKLAETFGENLEIVKSLRGQLAALTGDKQRANEIIASLSAVAAESSDAVGGLGFIYYFLGDINRFFEYMEKALAIHALPANWLLHNPLFEKAREDPRFVELMEKQGVPFSR